MLQTVAWVNAWLFHLICPEGEIKEVQQLWKQWLPSDKTY